MLLLLESYLNTAWRAREIYVKLLKNSNDFILLKGFNVTFQQVSISGSFLLPFFLHFETIEKGHDNNLKINTFFWSIQVIVLEQH